MARVLMYSTTGCKFCGDALDLLESHGINVKVVNLTVHPERREEMKIISQGKKTVPQIVFGYTHIGGLRELKQLEESGSLLDRIEECTTTIASEESEEDLSLSTGSSSSSYNAFSTGVSSFSEDDLLEDLLVSMTLVDGGLRRGTRRKKMRTDKRVFKASEYVDWLVNHQSMSVGDAVETGQAFIDSGLMRCMSKKKEVSPFCYDGRIYRFRDDDDVYLLNGFRDVRRRKGTSASGCEEVAKELQMRMLAISERYISRDGRAVDYHQIAQSRAYRHYLRATLALQTANLAELREETMQKAFWINLYNALTIHASIVIGHPKNALTRSRFFNKVSYLIGGHRYSLNDIEHGVLRANAKMFPLLRPRFRKGDARAAFSLPRTDPRIHFALVCGAKSCPPVNVYSHATLDDSLQWATEGFCSEEVIVDIDRKKITLSKLFSWYAKDFGGDTREVLEWILPFLEGEQQKHMQMLLEHKKTPKVGYAKYDWSQNGRGTLDALEDGSSESTEEQSVSSAPASLPDHPLSRIPRKEQSKRRSLESTGLSPVRTSALSRTPPQGKELVQQARKKNAEEAERKRSSSIGHPYDDILDGDKRKHKKKSSSQRLTLEVARGRKSAKGSAWDESKGALEGAAHAGSAPLPKGERKSKGKQRKGRSSIASSVDGPYTPPTTDDEERTEVVSGLGRATNSNIRVALKVFEIDPSQLVLEEQIGQGGFGAVYRGTYQGRTVAVKKLLSAMLSREEEAIFLKEIRMLSVLSHNNIVRFLGHCSGEDGSSILCLTEYMSRGSLHDVLNGGKRITFGSKVKMALDAAKGMAFLHESFPPVIHRDLKSHNLLVSSDYTIKVADFGLSKAESTGTNSKLGTLNWLAPEVLQETSAYTKAADVFSFGMVLWEMLTGDIPFRGRGPLQIVRALDAGARPPIPEEDQKEHSPYVNLLERCWAQDPEDRPTFPEIVEEFTMMFKHERKLKRKAKRLREAAAKKKAEEEAGLIEGGEKNEKNPDEPSGVVV